MKKTIYCTVKRILIVQSSYFAFSMFMYLLQDMFKEGAECELEIISRGVVSLTLLGLYYIMDIKEREVLNEKN